MQSTAASVAEYIASLPDDRRAMIEAIRNTIRANLDPQYQEGMQYGMIGYCVPHSVFPAGYHCDPKQPLPFAALASQKNYVSIYLMGVYCGCADGEGGYETAHARWFREAWVKAGKKLDMGRACLRVKKPEDLALDVLGEAIRRVPAAVYIAEYQKVLAQNDAERAARKAAGSAAARKTPAAAARKKKAA